MPEQSSVEENALILTPQTLADNITMPKQFLLLSSGNSYLGSLPHASATNRNVGVGRCRRKKRLPQADLCSHRLRWPVATSVQPGSERNPRADYQCFRPLALECSIGADALPPSGSALRQRPDCGPSVLGLDTQVRVQTLLLLGNQMKRPDGSGSRLPFSRLRRAIIAVHSVSRKAVAHNQEKP